MTVANAVIKWDFDALVAGASKESPSERMLLDNLIRCQINRIIAEGRTSDNELIECVKFAVKSAIQDLCTKSTPLVMLGDIFDTIPISRCEEVFSFVEEMIPTWNSHFESSRTHLLRLCNDLLRRLSRTVDTQFCGRILVFLARCLPLTEKSGLNITSQFNIDNLTRFEPESEGVAGSVAASVTASEDMEVEEGEMKEPTTTASSVPVDYALYCKFWQLQNFFSSPQSSYDKFKWKQFIHNANEVLSALASYKLEPPASSSSGSKRSKSDGNEDETGPSTKRSKMEEDDAAAERLLRNQDIRRRSSIVKTTAKTEAVAMEDGEAEDVYFAKYLTSQKLLQLQLNDSMFRRYVLVQFLILFQYLTAEVKFKDKKSHSLSEEQRKWVEEMTGKCYALFGETYPKGSDFAKSIKHILAREEHWNEWKNAACEDFTKRADKEKMALFKRRPKDNFSLDKLDLGNKELTALWNLCPDNFAACRAQERDFIPKLEDFLEEPFEQADPDNQVEADYKLVNNENFQWRALRLLSRTSCHFWSTTSPQVVTHMNEHLETLIKKSTADIPKFQKLTEDKKVEKAKAAEAAGEAAKEQIQAEEAERAKKVEETKQQEEEEENIVVQPESGSMDDEDLRHSSEPLVSEAQILELSTLIGSDWAKLADQMGLTPEEVILYKKKQVAEDVCTALLNQWLDQEGSAATTRKLRNLLLEAELFNEDVSAVLQKTDSEDETVEKFPVHDDIIHQILARS